MAVKSKRLRFEILKRDGFMCRYCGAEPESAVLHVDHVIPESKGGTDDPDNLVAACRDCNLGKAASPLGERTVSRKHVIAEMAVEIPMLALYVELFRFSNTGFGKDSRPMDWMRAVGAFHSFSDLLQAIEFMKENHWIGHRDEDDDPAIFLGYNGKRI